MAKLIETLALAGSRKADGTANASGKAWGFIVGTSTQTTLYGDADGTVVLTQPVTLDAAGKATIYIDQPITLRVETSTGASLQETDVQDAAGVVAVANAAFTGTLSSGSLGAGGVTDLDTVLTSALTSFGGTDFKYRESTGATLRTVSTWMREVHVSLKDWGAYGDGVHDDTVAIQNAVNRVIALGGGTVFAGPGIFLHSAPITNSSAVAVSILGSGSATTFKNTAAGTGFFVVSGSGGYSFRNFYVDHTSSSTGSAFTVSNGFDVLFDHVQVHNHLVGCTVGTAVQYIDFSYCRLIGTSASGVRAIKVTGNVSENLRISDCSLQGRADEASVEFTSATHGGVIIEDTYIYGGISFASVSSGHILLTGNRFDSNNTKNITVTGTVPKIYIGQNTGLDGVLNVSAVNVAFTPDWTNGSFFRVTATGAGITITINDPTPVPTVRGVRMLIRLFNNNGGVTTWTMGGTFRLSAVPNTVGGATTELLVEYDLERSIWAQVAQTVHNP